MAPLIFMMNRVVFLTGWGQVGRGDDVGSGWRSGARAGRLEAAISKTPFAKKKARVRRAKKEICKYCARYPSKVKSLLTRCRAKGPGGGNGLSPVCSCR